MEKKRITLDNILNDPEYEAICDKCLTDIRAKCEEALKTFKPLVQKKGPLLKLYEKKYFDNVVEYTKCVINVFMRRSLMAKDLQLCIRQTFVDVSVNVLNNKLIREKDGPEIIPEV